MLLVGPSGCFQSAPFTHCHHCPGLFNCTACVGGVNTSAPGCNISAAGFGVPGGHCFFNSSQSTARSATVLYFVASTNFANCAFVTSVVSIQNPSRRTRCTGRSSGRADGRSLPIRNSLPSIHTIPSSAAGGSRRSKRAHESIVDISIGFTPFLPKNHQTRRRSSSNVRSMLY